MANERATSEAALFDDSPVDFSGDNEIVVNGRARAKANIKKPPSAWKVALMAAPTGPLGMLAFGLAANFRNKSYMEKESARIDRAYSEREQLQGLLNKEMAIADPDEKRLIEFTRGRLADGYERIAGGDKSGYEIIEKANATLEGLIGGDIKARKEEQSKRYDFQRQIIGDSAKGYRNAWQGINESYQGTMMQSQKILDLVAQKDFDPNKPINKAHLAELLSMGGLMFKDSPDMLDAVTQGAGGLGAAGPWGAIASSGIGGIMTAIKAGDFKVTPEDYNRLALNMQKYAKIYTEQQMSTLGSQAGSLDKYARELGVIPEDYSLQDYISGGEKELRTNPNPHFTGGFQEDKSTPSPTEILLDPMGAGRKLGEKFKKRFFPSPSPPLIQPKRPTN